VRGTPVVTKVEVVAPYTLEVSFLDGKRRRVDLSENLNGDVFMPLRDPAYFARVFVDPVFHTVAWPNGADLAPEWLYEPDEEKYWGKKSVG
jgi:hypothetical protein